MVTRIDSASQVAINSLAYYIKGKVRSSIQSQEDLQRHYLLHMDDWRGGLGVEIFDPELAPNRFWWSTCNTLFKGHLILPRLAVTTANDPGTTPADISHLGGEVYGVWGTEIYKYNNSTDNWDSAVQTGLGASSGDFINITINDVSYLVKAYQSGYDYSSDGSSWSSSTTDVQYMTVWDNRLWGITAAGSMWYAYTPGTEKTWACLPIEGTANGEVVTDIFTARDTQGEIIIYVSTNRGLWAYDLENNRFVATKLTVPAGITNGAGSAVWRESIYYPAGGEIYEYTPGPQPTIREIGPGNDSHGLPDDQKGRIIRLIATHNELLALVDTTALSNNTGSSFSILAWNGKGWRCLHEHGSANIATYDMLASNAYGVYRLWFSYASDIDYINLPYEITNDLQVTDAAYAASSEHITPWLSVRQDADVVAVRLRVNVKDTSANETVVVDYDTDFSGSYTTLGTISSDGVTTYIFPNSTTPTGTSFTHIRFRLTLARGGTNTNTPDVLYVELEYRMKHKTRWIHEVDVDMGRTSPDGRDSRTQFANLRSAVESATMIPFTFRTNDGSESYTYYVDVLKAEGVEETGADFKSEYRLVLAES